MKIDELLLELLANKTEEAGEQGLQIEALQVTSTIAPIMSKESKNTRDKAPIFKLLLANRAEEAGKQGQASSLLRELTLCNNCSKSELRVTKSQGPITDYTAWHPHHLRAYAPASSSAIYI
ncbi:5088_t:CDS:2, partial [Dentiscutata heterogama]